MILDESLAAYFRKGLIQPHSIVIAFTAQLRADDSQPVEALIRENFDPEFAAKLIGANSADRVDDDPVVWDESDEPHAVSAGFCLMAEDRNWEEGTISGTIYPESERREEWLFWDEEEHLATGFERPEFEYTLSGLCFDFSSIEMLLPSHALAGGEMPVEAVRERRTATGRPPKWDWESAMEHLISKAQTPDGLPTGPGAQAEIERMIADWFIRTENASPSESQIRVRAQRIMRTVGKRAPAF